MRFSSLTPALPTACTPGLLRRTLRALWLLGLLMLVLAAASVRAQMQPVPPLAARVTDNAAMLTPQQHGAREAVLADYQARTGSQIAILLVSSTAP